MKDFKEQCFQNATGHSPCLGTSWLAWRSAQ